MERPILSRLNGYFWVQATGNKAESMNFDKNCNARYCLKGYFFAIFSVSIFSVRSCGFPLNFDDEPFNISFPPFLQIFPSFFILFCLLLAETLFNISASLLITFLLFRSILFFHPVFGIPFSLFFPSIPFCRLIFFTLIKFYQFFFARFVAC